MVLVDRDAPHPSSLPSSGGSHDMAFAYRQATEEDTRSVLNAMSDPAKARELKFYLIPSAWLQACLPFLTNQSSERAANSIPTADLLESEHAVSDEESESAVVNGTNQNHVLWNKSSPASTANSQVVEDYRKRRRQRWEEKTRKFSDMPENVSIRGDLLHTRDYCLVGGYVWILLSAKFGCDVAIARNCVANPARRGQLSVCIDESTLIPIPLSGYFTYRAENLGAAVVLPQARVQPQPQDPDFVSEDDDTEAENDLFPTTDGMNCDTLGGSLYGNEDTKMPPFDEEAPPDEDGSLTVNPSRGHEFEMESEIDRGDLSSDQLVVAPSPAKRKRYASGLGNLGNTCFMNSTLQCLAHTDPLRLYFVSSQYRRDLNRDNPLGTGGELASQFADLLQEMWGTDRRARSLGLYGRHNGLSGTVYPSSFKTALGRHAEQFLGYDQHDSQEFATYLLDALHEDTNRVTKKPYIEKPEQGEDESDDVAAEKGWKLHLQREDSRVLENFMGQVKSRVQCPTEGCGRVSTTFDPFMYLSVPIPGSMEKSYPFTFVPLKGSKLNFMIKASRNTTFAAIRVKMASELDKAKGLKVEPSDLVIVDMWNNGAYRWYDDGECLDQIRDQDETYVYELQRFSGRNRDEYEELLDELDFGPAESTIRVPDEFEYHLGPPFDWQRDIEKSIKQETLANTLFNSRRFQIADLVAVYKHLHQFLLDCHSSMHDTEPPVDDFDLVLDDLSHLSSTFSVSSRLEYYTLVRRSTDLHDYVLDRLRKIVSSRKEGVLISVDMRLLERFGSSKGFTPPLCVRVPVDMSVYEFRLHLAARLQPFLDTDYLGQQPLASVHSKTTPSAHDGMLDDTTFTGGMDPASNDTVAHRTTSRAEPALCSAESRVSQETPSPPPPQGSPDPASLCPAEALILRQIPLTFTSKQLGDRGGLYGNSNVRSLGALSRDGSGASGGRVVALASPNDPQEQDFVVTAVGPEGSVHLHWAPELSRRCFSKRKYEAAEDLNSPEDAIGVRTRRQTKNLTVLDCIEKYCNKEQLEETEMWYCNRCKDHVRAWKQFHLYRTPPILIVHLKRFHYQSSTHRREKIEDFIDFPLEGLDLTDKVMHWSDEEKPIYDCYAVSNHYGGLGGGHYTAYALSDGGEWCHFDDSRVTTGVDPKEVVSAASYVLYYRRRDVVLDDWHFVDSPVPAIVQDHPDTCTEAIGGSHYVTVQEVLDAEMNSTTSSRVDTLSSPPSVDQDDEEEDLFRDDSDDYDSAAAAVPGSFPTATSNLGFPPQ